MAADQADGVVAFLVERRMGRRRCRERCLETLVAAARYALPLYCGSTFCRLPRAIGTPAALWVGCLPVTTFCARTVAYRRRFYLPYCGAFMAGNTAAPVLLLRPSQRHAAAPSSAGGRRNAGGQRTSFVVALVLALLLCCSAFRGAGRATVTFEGRCLRRE